MRAPIVAKLLREVGLPDTMNPHGFQISADFRVECAGGIGGRTDMWRIVNIKSGRVFNGWHRYKKTFKPALLEWCQSLDKREESYKPIAALERERDKVETNRREWEEFLERNRERKAI